MLCSGTGGVKQTWRGCCLHVINLFTLMQCPHVGSMTQQHALPGAQSLEAVYDCLHTLNPPGFQAHLPTAAGMCQSSAQRIKHTSLFRFFKSERMASTKPFELYSLKGGLWLDEAATQRFHLKGINWFGTGALLFAF